MYARNSIHVHHFTFTDSQEGIYNGRTFGFVKNFTYSGMNIGRLKKELEMLEKDPGPGVSAWLDSEGSLHQLTGLIVGPEESPYEGGMFYITINIPQRYV